MQLLLKGQRDELIANGKATEAAQSNETTEPDHTPVVKMFNPTGSGTWLFTEMDEHGVLFGLCDPGLGSPEIGYQSLSELEEFKGHLGLGIERDRHWEASKTLNEYATEARNAGRVAA